MPDSSLDGQLNPSLPLPWPLCASRGCCLGGSAWQKQTVKEKNYFSEKTYSFSSVTRTVLILMAVTSKFNHFFLRFSLFSLSLSSIALHLPGIHGFFISFMRLQPALLWRPTNINVDVSQQYLTAVKIISCTKRAL